jgi:3-oxoacyl-[acyl-carrier-protein] synthase II
VRASVAVLGIGAVSAFGSTADAFRDRLLEGRTGIAQLKGFNLNGCRSTLAAEVTDFEPSAWLSPMRLRRLDRTGVYAVASAKLAIADARVCIPVDGDDHDGVVLGTWSAGGQSTQQFLEALFRSGPSGAPALLFDSTVGNSAASLVGLEFKLRGPNVTVSHKEASGLAAIATAVDLLREGRSSALIAGGVDAVYEPFYKAHDRFAVMSTDTNHSSRVAPFDRSRSGFVLGEGGFAMWLEPASARTAGSCHGEILGVGVSSAAVPVNAWPDSPDALIRTMRLALDDAGLQADDVDVVYASANATELDTAEAQALAALFANRRTVVTSIKGAVGEFGASGSASCAAALLCGRAGQVPPIAGLSAADPKAADLHLATAAMPAPGPIALVNSFASGGALFSAVLRVGDRGASGAEVS